MSSLDLAFVLLGETRTPDAGALVASIRELGFDAAQLAPKQSPDDGLTQVDLGDPAGSPGMNAAPPLLEQPR